MHIQCLRENLQGRYVVRDLVIDGRALRVLKLTHRSRMRYSRAVPKGGGGAGCTLLALLPNRN